VLTAVVVVVVVVVVLVDGVVADPGGTDIMSILTTSQIERITLLGDFSLRWPIIIVESRKKKMEAK
jgi:hypothetical protein